MPRNKTNNRRTVTRVTASAAVLCTGPGLPDILPQEYLIVIGVNRAVIAHKCDWWSFIDHQTFAEVCLNDGGPIGKPKIMTSNISVKQMGSKKPDMHDRFHNHEWITSDKITNPPRVELCWSMYSSTCAVALAINQGAVSIDLYGAPMDGSDEFDGKPSPRNHRNPNRWTNERQLLETLVEWASKRSIKIRRVDSRGKKL